MTEKRRDPHGVIEDLHVYMDEAFDMLEKGEYVELMSLNDTVAQLCQDIQKLPIQNALELKEPVSELIERLDDLKTFMLAHKEVLSEQIANLEGTKTAAKAYQKSNHLPTKSDT